MHATINSGIGCPFRRGVRGVVVPTPFGDVPCVAGRAIGGGIFAPGGGGTTPGGGGAASTGADLGPGGGAALGGGAGRWDIGGGGDAGGGRDEGGGGALSEVGSCVCAFLSGFGLFGTELERLTPFGESEFALPQAPQNSSSETSGWPQ
ncbi:MAG: hypothetical protein ACE5EQ_00020 [Phycisphaerae bacterium]